MFLAAAVRSLYVLAKAPTPLQQSRPLSTIRIRCKNPDILPGGMSGPPMSVPELGTDPGGLPGEVVAFQHAGRFAPAREVPTDHERSHHVRSSTADTATFCVRISAVSTR